VPVHVLPNALHALGQLVAASMHQPLLQSRELTGVTRPLESLQSQNQLPQSSAVLHATLVAPLGLLGSPVLGSGSDSVGLVSSVGDDDDGCFELEPLGDFEDEPVVGVLSGPPEHATTQATRPSEKRIEKGFMAARVCNDEASAFSAVFRGRRCAVAQGASRLAPAWRYRRHLPSTILRCFAMASAR
jgi:hypothetical protein